MARANRPFAAWRDSNESLVEANLFEEGSRRGLRGSVKFDLEDLLANAILSHGLRPLALPHVAPHHQAMRVLPPWIMGKQVEGVLP